MRPQISFSRDAYYGLHLSCEALVGNRERCVAISDRYLFHQTFACSGGVQYPSECCVMRSFRIILNSSGQNSAEVPVTNK